MFVAIESRQILIILYFKQAANEALVSLRVEELSKVIHTCAYQTGYYPHRIREKVGLG